MRLLPPLCLFLALAALIGGFVLFIVPPPEPSMELHAARVRGDDEYRELLENELQRRQTGRKVMIVALFVAAGGFAVAAFLTLGGTPR